MVRQWNCSTRAVASVEAGWVAMGWATAVVAGVVRAETVAATETTTEYRFARSSRVIARGGRARGRVLTITPKIVIEIRRGWWGGCMVVHEPYGES